VYVSETDLDVSQIARNQVTTDGEWATAVARKEEENYLRHVDPIWSCNGLVPVSELIFAAFSHSHELRLGATDRSRGRGFNRVFL
jgi:hypothetical protein